MCGETVIPHKGGNLMLVYIVFNIHIKMQIVVMETKVFCEIVHCQPDPCFPFKRVLQYQYPTVSSEHVLPEHSREVHLIPADKFHLVVCTILRQNPFICLPQYSVLMRCLPRWELGSLNNGSHWYKNLQHNASQWRLHLLSVFILSTLDSMIFSYNTSSTTLQLSTAVRWDNPHTTHTNEDKAWIHSAVLLWLIHFSSHAVYISYFTQSTCTTMG